MIIMAKGEKRTANRKRRKSKDKKRRLRAGSG